MTNHAPDDPLVPIPEVPGAVEAAAYDISGDVPPIPATVARARRLQGYNLYLRGLKKQEIAAATGVSPSLVSRWAREDRWEERRKSVSLKAEDILDQAVSTEIASTLAYMRTKISERLFELDMACKKGNVTAILAWLNRAGLSPKGEDANDKKPKPIGIVDDITTKGITKPMEANSA